MENAAELVQAARDAYGRRDWSGARDLFRRAGERDALSADDLYALGDAAWWLGRVDESVRAGEQAYRRYLELGRPQQAAMAAIGVAVNLFLRGDDVVGSGWMSRAQRLLQDEPEGIVHGYALYLVEVEAALGGPDLDAVIASARRVRDIGRRHADPNLVAAGILGEGRALVRHGQVPEGMALLDEAMLAVLSGELDPEWAGNIYCHLMAACHELADIRRAGQWTEATERWLEHIPSAVLFTGICRVHRAQVLQTRGAWKDAEQEAARVCQDLTDISVATAAEGHYQVGELRRLRGELGGAEEAYRHAHRLGRDPQPGLALLRLAQGQVDAASTSIRSALAAETHDRLARARLCAAQVEITIAAGDLEAARSASDELDGIAASYGSSGLEAMAAQARGAVLLAEGHTEAALPILRDACRRWQDLDAPYLTARVRFLLAAAYQRLDDQDAASLELDAAATVFDRLGATLDARKLAALRGRPTLPGGLTRREAEVLVLVAAGKTNREVADSLGLSNKTVARHLSNIFTKLGVSTRTEAAAYAFAHRLTATTRG